MKNYEKVLAEAIRIEHEQDKDKVYIVFEVKDEKFKQLVKTSWSKDIEYKLINKYLIESEGEE